MERIAEPENLRLAFWRAARGKSAKAEVRRFRDRLEAELTALRAGLLSGDYPIGRFSLFTVWDPKKRLIHAAAFPERVLHHALMNVCEPRFERLLITDTYACRRGRGQWAAVRRAERFAAASPFFLKLDVRRYFDSIPHDRLLAGLARHFKDPLLLHWFRRIVECHETTSGRGLPIGCLTSQHFANFYLGAQDRFVKERLRCRRYVRYMDDSVVWGSSSADLRRVLDEIRRFLEADLRLVLKPEPYINRTEAGMDFLGCRVYPGWATLNRRSRLRFRRKLAEYEERHATGAWDEAELQRHAETLIAFTRQVCAWRFRQRTLEGFGSRPIGLEPREPRGQLEQQRAELPVREPQQEQPVEQEQQPRVPRRPSSDPGCPPQGTEPAVIQSGAGDPGAGKRKPDPPGGGSEPRAAREASRRVNTCP